MHLRRARLCLDCEEVHEEQHCPRCASDQFTFLTRWVPVPDGRKRPRTVVEPSPDLETYRQIVKGTPAPRGRLFTRALVGLGAAGLAGLVFGATRARGTAAEARDDQADDPPMD
ncbi:MAG: hypothetical protein AB7O28_21780 [Vicinamibacterales bacterium]